MPFISRYKLSNSMPLGLGCVMSTGISMAPISSASSSTQSTMILGYLRIEPARTLQGQVCKEVTLIPRAAVILSTEAFCFPHADESAGAHRSQSHLKNAGTPMTACVHSQVQAKVFELSRRALNSSATQAAVAAALPSDSSCATICPGDGYCCSIMSVSPIPSSFDARRCFECEQPDHHSRQDLSPAACSEYRLLEDVNANVLSILSQAIYQVYASMISGLDESGYCPEATLLTPSSS
jgi:hypothetical protein